MEGDRELKAWEAIARYMQSFEDTDGDGIANVPQYYATMHDRKVVDDNKHISSLVTQPNKFSVLIVAVLVIVLFILIVLIWLVCKAVRKIMKKPDHTTKQNK